MKIEFTGDLQRLDVKSGDIFVVTTEHRLEEQDCKLIKDHFEGAFPGHKVVVLSDGMKLGVIRQEEAA